MTSDDRSFLNWAAMAIAVAALFLGFFAIGKVGAPEQAAGPEGSTEVSVVELSLGAFKLSPEHIMAPPGQVIVRITNIDSQNHNLNILGSRTKDLQPGESQDLELGELAVGVYKMFCEIPGHNEAGMNGNLHIIMNAEPGPYTGSATSDGEVDHFHGFDTWQEMQKTMDDRALRFIQEEKSEFGGQPLEFEMVDGFKQFVVTAQLADWEVEPGRIVEAYTYNGTVPAPSIHVEVGDMVRVILKNELPTPTIIHWHGIRVPNAMDGVPPFTQDVVVPGDEFVYEFEALEPAVGIYHSHNGASQVLDGLFGTFTVGQMQTPDVLLDQGFKATPDQTIEMTLNDAGVIGLSLNGKSFPATQAYSGTVGDTVMVHYQNEGLMAHPMHLHQPLGWIIAKDGRELLVPIPGDTINIAPGERYTVLLKLTDPGVWAWHCHILTHAERDDGMFGMVTAFIVNEA